MEVGPASMTVSGMTFLNPSMSMTETLMWTFSSAVFLFRSTCTLYLSEVVCGWKIAKLLYFSELKASVAGNCNVVPTPLAQSFVFRCLLGSIHK